MPTASVTTDTRAFEEAYASVLKDMGKLARRGVDTMAKHVKEVAQELVHKRTETLEIDIQIRGSGEDAKGYYVDVGTTEADVEYGLYQEFGLKKKRHMEAHPFMRPAIEIATAQGLPIDE